jgi:hypothetical protein
MDSTLLALCISLRIKYFNVGTIVVKRPQMGFSDFIHKLGKSLHKFRIYSSVVGQNFTAAEPVSAPFIVATRKGESRDQVEFSDI